MKEPQSKTCFSKNQRVKTCLETYLRRAKGKKWRFNQSTLYLDFLAGNQTYHCTPWGNPTRNVFGWQKPCYLLVGEGYASTFDELINDTEWDKYGTGVNPKCADCMVHCGYEATAVDDTFNNPLKALKVFLAGPKTQGDLAPEVPFYYEEEPEAEAQPIIPMGNIIERAGTEKREVA